MAYAFRRPAPRPFSPRPVKAKPALPAPPPSVVIDAVLRFHDQTQDQGGGRSLLRLSPNRLRDPEVEAALGRDAFRAAKVAILWNEEESQIIRVLEAA